MENSPEIVITGLGVASSIGSGVETFWNALMNGACGITLFADWDNAELLAAGLNNPFTGSIKELDKKRIRPRKSIKVMARDIQVGVAAADYAWEDAQLNEKPVDPERQGIVYGAMMPLADLSEIVPLYKGAMDEEQKFVPSRFGNNMDAMYPLWMLKYLPNMTACHIGVANDLRGPSNTLVVGDMGGVAAIIEAIRAIDRGAADLMYTGGCNSSTMPQNQSHFQMFPETFEKSDVTKAYRPFDVNRDGMVLGECGGSVIIETRESAEKRGVPVYGKVLGYGETAEAVWNSGLDFAPQQEEVKINVEKFTGKCIFNAIKLAMERSGLKSEDLAFVMAQGLASKFHDQKETEAIAAAVGSDIPVTCVNSATGYAFCGSSAVSVVAAVEALKQNTIPAIVNCAEPDPALPVDLVTGSPRSIEAGKKAALVVSYNYYGQAAALVVSK
ncbi:MAG: beta-ketoacyl synthase N-terminal-like domain-containing protein [Thermoguttaceae bacterium]|nr:hypothetical protein [Thermoguttaceae bacterium]MDO4856943.1 beta-ketoacyl synthase N-terminal-like domain-containing protein [Thermoguttaceae bacterium]